MPLQTLEFINLDGQKESNSKIFCIYGIISTTEFEQLSKSEFEMEYRISKLRLNKKNRQHIACGDYRHNLRVGMKFQNSRGEVSLKVFVNVQKSQNDLYQCNYNHFLFCKFQCIWVACWQLRALSDSVFAYFCCNFVGPGTPILGLIVFKEITFYKA